MAWNPFKGGKYDLSKTALSVLPGGDTAGIYTHNQVGTVEDRSSTADSGEVFGPEQPYGPQQPQQADPTSYAPDTKFLGGVAFDLNDPGQFQAYLAKADEILNTDFEDYRTRTGQLKDFDIAQAKAQEDEILFNIDRALKKVTEQEGQYNTDFARSVSDLSEGFRQGSAKRQAFYASIAPRVYQSSQGTSQEYAENKWKEGQTRLDEDKTKAMLGFKEASEDYARQGQNAQNQFNLYKTQREAQAQDEIANQANSVRAQRDKAMEGGFNYAGEMRQATGNSTKWTNPVFQERNLNYSPSNVNLNELMSFIKFQPNATFQPTTKPVATPASGGESLQNYLGQTTKENDSTLNQFKSGNLSY